MVSLIWQQSYFIILSHVLGHARAELFTAVCEMEPLFDTQKRIIDDLDRYINKANQRLQILKKHLHIYRTEHQKAMEDIPNYLGNPINAFTLIKRLTTDLDHIEDSISAEHVKNTTMRHAELKYPTVEDLTGAAQALARIQDVYSLKVEELSVGIVNGIHHSTPMTPSDCYELGRALFHVKAFKKALNWMIESLHKFEKSANSSLIQMTDILEYISFSHYLLGDVQKALEWAKRILDIDPKHPRAAHNVLDFKKRVTEKETQEKNLRGETGNLTREQKLSKTYKTTMYDSLCRGEVQIPAKVTKRLHCRYLHEHHPFLRLAPIKMELVYSQPDVVVFHDVLSDEEIKLIKAIAKPRFKRSMVRNAITDDILPANIRISKSGWVRDEELLVVGRLSQRVSDMTGLSMLSAETLQVVNYGIGGYYEPHLDFEMKQSYNSSGPFGDKLATVMFYMSDVAEGGATVFTELGLTVSPIKGSAVFWMNLHPSGEGDRATRHAGCPVLRGSKWVCNKWIHQGGQELLKPCSPHYQPDRFVRRIPPPVLTTAQ